MKTANHSLIAHGEAQAGQTAGGIRLSLIFLFLFASR